MDRLKIAKELLKVAKELVADSDYHYIYDPEHKKHPGGGYQKTEKGWQKGKQEKQENQDREEEKQFWNDETPFPNEFSSTKELEKAYNHLIDQDDQSFMNDPSDWEAMQQIAGNENTSKQVLEDVIEHFPEGTEIGDSAKFNLKSRELEDEGFDMSKLSPESREKVKNMDDEEFENFLEWFRWHREYKYVK